MNLVNKEHIPLLQVGKQCRQIALLLNGRTAGDTNVYTHLIGNNARQRGLAQSGRTVQQHMIQRLATGACRLNVNGQVLFHFILPNIVLQGLGTQGILYIRIRLRQAGRHNTIF